MARTKCIFVPILDPPTRLVDIYWMAGILEGEGCFSVKNTNFNSANITYVTTDFDSAIRVATFLRTSINKRSYKTSPTSKTCYSVGVTGRRAIGWIFTLYHLMSARRKARMRELIHLWKTWAD